MVFGKSWCLPQTLTRNLKNHWKFWKLAQFFDVVVLTTNITLQRGGIRNLAFKHHKKIPNPTSPQRDVCYKFKQCQKGKGFTTRWRLAWTNPVLWETCHTLLDAMNNIVSNQKWKLIPKYCKSCKCSLQSQFIHYCEVTMWMSVVEFLSLRLSKSPSPAYSAYSEYSEYSEYSISYACSAYFA